jgi:alpha-L-fucosidase
MRGKMNTVYEPTLKSLRQHQVPAWFHNAKLGIFIHWGLYSVPGWAPPTGELHQAISNLGWSGWFAQNPYAEWYGNTVKIEDSPTRQFHSQVYGDDFPYADFAPLFTQAATKFDPAAWADLFAEVGARYVVLTTKHHDGFLLWPSQHRNPYRPDFCSERDLVGELTDAVRARGMRMGLYYSGGLDWTFDENPIQDVVDMLTTAPQSAEYVDYVDRHWRELIERYRPAVLWNDICYPAALDLKALFADYYNAVPDGVVNDRSMQLDVGWLGRNPVGRAVLRFVVGLALRSFRAGGLPSGAHADFKTPEYTSLSDVVDYKWEATRGLGYSFGYNQNETAEHMLSLEELVRLFVDIVSKNGNLLLNVGPMADGTIPDLQRERLLGLGEWLSVNGEAIFGTRPWIKAEGMADDGVPVRFTTKGDDVYAILLDTPLGKDREVSLASFGFRPDTAVSLLGHDAALAATCESGRLTVYLPESMPVSPAYTLKISPAPLAYKRVGMMNVTAR